MSFVYAFNGLKTAFIERNFKIHILAAILVLILGLVFKISNLEFIILIILICLVLIAEILNTAIEVICNIVRDKLNLDFEATKAPRDLGAAIVLLTAISSVLIGMIIFLPKVI